jgi:hypothetical protein
MERLPDKKDLDKKDLDKKDPIPLLQQEIRQLESLRETLKNELRSFEHVIHSQLDRAIARMSELNDLYKAQKNAKKAKRLEQKKRGKNYQEPTGLITNKSSGGKEAELELSDKEELRRLYKEAVVQVHPDKIAHGGEEGKIQDATALTAQLNGIYKRGDLEELIYFYQNVILGNLSTGSTPHPKADSKQRISSLIKKKEVLETEVAQLQKSFIYQVLKTYKDPLTFIDELRIQFQERIKQLERRTRQHK